MSVKFALEGWQNMRGGAPTVELAHDVVAQGLTKEKLLGFSAFQEWLRTLKRSLERQVHHTHPFSKSQHQLKHIDIQAFDTKGKGGPLLFVKLVALIQNDKGETLPGAVFLRGGSVAILMILRPTDSPDERWVVMTEQARIPAGSLCFKEIPAGMIDEERNFAGVAAKEIQEEVGLVLKADDLINMTEKVMLQESENPEKLEDAMYPSPGGCDEFIAIFLWERIIDRLQMENLKDKLTGNRAEKEKIRVSLQPYEDLLKVAARDGKTLAAWSLYEYLKRMMPEELKDDEEDAF